MDMIIKHLAVAATVAAALSLGAETVLNERTQSLAGVWRLCQADDPAVACPVTVPGDIHTALLAAKIIPDPYVGANEYRTLWVGRKDWNYNRSFTVDAALLAAKSVVLRLDEVDTFCTILVNGRVAGRTDNRFRRWDLDVKALLHPGENTIEARFESAEKKSEQLADQRGPDRFHIQNSWAHHIMHVRKPQCHGGWDWGIDLMTAGLLGRVELVATDLARIDYVGCDARFAADDAICEVAVAADVFSPAGGEAPFTVAIGDARTTRTVRLEPGDNHLTATVTVDHPCRWWPAGEGEQNLYPLALSVGSAALERKIGLRTIEVLSAPDAAPYPRTGKQGNPMTFRVNGRDIFAKGVNWIPCDAFESRQTPTRYRNLLESCRAANMNMVRVWGGGRFEGDAFYEICDELGLLVYQDFMFSCALYPDDEPFYASVRAELAHQIRRLRDHPSIAVWSGDNECISLLTGDFGWPSELDRHVANFHRRTALSASMVAKYDPNRRFWPSSPCRGTDEVVRLTDYTRGDVHNWRIWFGQRPVWNYWEFQPRFCSEFGAQSMPSADVAATFCSQEAIDHLLPELLYHQKHPNGHRRLTDFLRRHFFAPATSRDFIYLTQACQALAIRTATEYWRTLRPWCMGILVWQLNDNWPVASWSSVDYGGKWKPLQYQLKRSFAPLLVVAVPTEKSYAAREGLPKQNPYDDRDIALAPYELALYAVNDRNAAFDATLYLRCIGFDGEVRSVTNITAKLPPRSSVKLGEMAETAFGDIARRRGSFLHLELSARGADGAVDHAVNDWRFDEYRYLKLQSANVVAQAAERDGRWTVTLSCERPAFEVWVNADGIAGEFDDNLITLLPGEPRTLVFTPSNPATTFDVFRRSLTVRDAEKSKAK